MKLEKEEIKSESGPLLELVLKLATESTEVNVPEEDLKDLMDEVRAEDTTQEDTNGVNGEELTMIADMLRAEVEKNGRSSQDTENGNGGALELLSRQDVPITPNHVGFRDLMNATRFWKATQMMGTRKATCHTNHSRFIQTRPGASFRHRIRSKRRV